MSTRSDAVKGVVLIIVASALFGGCGTFAKTLFNVGLNPLQVTWLRLTGCAVLLVAAAIPLLRTMKRPPVWGLIAYGLTAIAGVQAFYFLAVERVPVGIALLLEFMGPVVVVAWIRFVRHTRLPKAAVIGTLLSVAGLAVVVEIWSGLRLDTLGLLAGAAAAACQAGYFLGGERLTESVDVRVLLAVGFVVGSLAITPLAAPWSMDWSALTADTVYAAGAVPAWVTLVALVAATALAYAAGLPALKLLSAPVAGGMAYAEVVIAAVVAWLLLGEALTVPQLVGGAIVIAGVFTAQRAVNTRVPEPMAALPARVGAWERVTGRRVAVPGRTTMLTLGNGPLSTTPPHRVNYRIDGPAHKLMMTEFPRRVRAVFAGETVLDTRAGMLLYESALLPQLYVPREDVRAELLASTDRSTHCPFKGDASYWSIRAGGRVADNAVWGYPEPNPGAPWLAGYQAFYWDGLDSWYDEDEEVFGHLRDLYTRVDVVATRRVVRVLAGDVVVAETGAPKLLSETGLPNRYYLPPDSVRDGMLERGDTRTYCPYKGRSTYWSLRLDGELVPDVAWSYAEPLNDARDARDHLCFLHDRLTVEVDGTPLD